MPNSRRHLQQIQKCHRNYQHNQPRQQSQLQQQRQRQQQQHSLSAKYLRRYHDRLQLATAIAIILLNIAAEHSCITAVATQMATATAATADVSDAALMDDIRSVHNNEFGGNQNDVAGKMEGGSYSTTGTDSQHSGTQQHRNGLHKTFSTLDKEVVDRLIKQWAPIVWLAPEEKFLPLGVEEFLNHVHPMDKDKTFIPGMPIGDDSKKAYLVTNAEIEELLENEKSFIYGRNPTESPVPIYAVVTLCHEPMQKTTLKPSPPPTPQPSQLNTAQQKNLILTSPSNFNPSGSATTNFHNSPLPLGAAIPMSSTRGPYIPVSIDPFDVHNDTVRRSSRLYPVFKRVRRNTPPHNLPLAPLPASPPAIIFNLPPKGLVVEPYEDLVLSESRPIDAENENRAVAEIPTTDSPAQADNSGQVNNFIANLADNVKFSMPTEELLEDNNIDVDSNFERLATSGPIFNDAGGQSSEKRRRKVPSFHVTYWMFYPYSQGKTMCTISLGPLGSIPFPAVYGFCLGRRKDIGSHIGDWEHMSLYFTGDAEPEAMYVSAHDAGAYYSYNRLTGSFEFKKQETRKGILQRPNFPKTVTTFNNHPVLFAAKGSHGLWTAPGKHRFVKVARLYDINGFGTPWNTWKSVDITYENLKSYGRALVPSWLSFKGKWGNPKSKCHPFRRIGLNFCEYTDGPTGIPLKEPHFQCDAA
ncbi:PREDICTED: uncharacterized protein LOC108369100 [Rhagoletis zephyria]|uniref:uncharacterized protein LOC108369100 n=1 Tax=Rhagoletis zephyria TaxID=28612 RepID=UPI00081144A3|nr:PREDICTED: uncharacterized protein LOC108369100 [Rhagoletis zephyria]XP_017479589.1 PREDICTED: uncharacterized protein LOC108369100 [Rhagoletis zephyria]